MLSDIFAVFKHEIGNHGLRLFSVIVPKFFTFSTYFSLTCKLDKLKKLKFAKPSQSSPD